MTEQEITERLKALPYEVPADISPRAVSTMMAAVGDTQQAEEKFWEHVAQLFPEERQGFFAAARQTQQMMDGDNRVDRDKLERMNRGPIAKIWDTVMALWRFVCDGDAPWAGKILAMSALLYLVMPLDAIPDVLPFVGLTDDAGVITAAALKLATELKKYLP